jgi:hypothetical protein
MYMPRTEERKPSDERWAPYGVAHNLATQPTALARPADWAPAPALLADWSPPTWLHTRRKSGRRLTWTRASSHRYADLEESNHERADGIVPGRSVSARLNRFWTYLCVAGRPRRVPRRPATRPPESGQGLDATNRLLYYRNR